MTRRNLVWASVLALPLAIAGAVLGPALAREQNQAGAVTEGYTCPVTGEELPCPLCCPYGG